MIRVISMFLMAMALQAHSEVLLESTFDNNNVPLSTSSAAPNHPKLDKNIDQLKLVPTARVSWSGKAADTASSLTALSPEGGFIQFNKGACTKDTLVVSASLSTKKNAHYGYSFTFTPARSVQLTKIEARAFHMSRVGNPNVFESDFVIEIPELGWSRKIESYNYSPNVATHLFDLSGEALTLSAATQYTVKVYMTGHQSGRSIRAGFDGLRIEGSSPKVPMPTSLSGIWWLGLAGLVFCFCARGRRQTD